MGTSHNSLDVFNPSESRVPVNLEAGDESKPIKARWGASNPGLRGLGAVSRVHVEKSHRIWKVHWVPEIRLGPLCVLSHLMSFSQSLGGRDCIQSPIRSQW